MLARSTSLEKIRPLVRIQPVPKGTVAQVVELKLFADFVRNIDAVITQW